MTNKADAIQRKLYKAYGKVGKTLGYAYDVYRAEELTNPIDPSTWIDRQNVSFSQDNKYNKAHDKGLSIWLCWVDGRLNKNTEIQQGDMLYDVLTESTYFIASAQAHLPIRAIKANSRITVSRVGSYGDTGDGYGVVEQEIGTDIPASILQPNSGGYNGQYIPAANPNGDSIPNYVINVWDPTDLIQINDIIVAQDGTRSEVHSKYITDVGTELTTKAMKP